VQVVEAAVGTLLRASGLGLGQPRDEVLRRLGVVDLEEGGEVGESPLGFLLEGADEEGAALTQPRLDVVRVGDPDPVAGEGGVEL
jgi:hypothetical protein